MVILLSNKLDLKPTKLGVTIQLISIDTDIKKKKRQV